MESFLEGVACACIVAAILTMSWWGAMNDPAFDTRLDPKCPTNMGKAWVPE